MQLHFTASLTLLYLADEDLGQCVTHCHFVMERQTKNDNYSKDFSKLRNRYTVLMLFYLGDTTKTNLNKKKHRTPPFKVQLFG